MKYELVNGRNELVEKYFGRKLEHKRLKIKENDVEVVRLGNLLRFTFCVKHSS